METWRERWAGILAAATLKCRSFRNQDRLLTIVRCSLRQRPGPWSTTTWSSSFLAASTDWSSSFLAASPDWSSSFLAASTAYSGSFLAASPGWSSSFLYDVVNFKRGWRMLVPVAEWCLEVWSVSSKYEVVSEVRFRSMKWCQKSGFQRVLQLFVWGALTKLLVARVAYC